MQRSLHLLLVEDEAPKRGHIERLVRGVLPSARLSAARSVNSALDILESGDIDFLLLDMSLPTFDIGDRESGGAPPGLRGNRSSQTHDDGGDHMSDAYHHWLSRASCGKAERSIWLSSGPNSMRSSPHGARRPPL